MAKANEKVTVPGIRARKGKEGKITCLTAYDFPFASILDEAGIDLVLVGDSVGVVVQGGENTLRVTMEQMLYHTEIVSRGVKRALVIGDMPFLSYQCGVDEAVRNAGRFLQAGASAVKLEGGRSVENVIRGIAGRDIPVMGHVGLTPQSIHRMGGYKVQKQKEKILDDAKAVEDAGAFAVVLEGIPTDLANEITEAVSIPTIGIGAGPHCDGQVLVIHDLLGLFDRFQPSFVKRYANLREEASKAVRAFREEVRSGTFPGREHSYS